MRAAARNKRAKVAAAGSSAFVSPVQAADDAVRQGKDNKNSEVSGDSVLNARGGGDMQCKGWGGHAMQEGYTPVAGAGENQRLGIGQGVAAGAFDYSLKDLTTEGEGEGHVWLVIA